MSRKFVHIHLHTEYSLLDGLTKTKKLMKKVKEMGMDSVAITDHGALYGAVEFYKAAKAEGIKPIIGLEAYTTTGDHKDRTSRENHHLLLLAKDEEGYKNLMKISSIAHVEGYYYKPRISRELIAKYSKGLMCTSACPASELASHIVDDDYEGAKKLTKWFYDVFGEDYYLEIQNHKTDTHIHSNLLPEIKADLERLHSMEVKIKDMTLKLSRDMGIPLVATNDAHYLNVGDAEAQDVLVCVATGKQVTDVKRIRFIDCPEFYVKTADEMEALFPDLPEALDNTVKIAEKSEIELTTLGKWFFPKFNVPDQKTADEYLRELAYKELPNRVDKVDDTVKERLDYELETIINKGYAPYFLIVRAMVQWANEEGIITNTRGSAAGCLVSFVLGITTVNPLTYYLPFERFLNPFRPTPPDIDFDVSDNRREDIIRYMTETYGKEKVAQICAFGRMLAKAAARDVARVLGYPYAVGDKISKMIPPPKQGFPVNIPRAYELSTELKTLHDTDPDARRVLDLAQQVEGSARHISVHAAGVVIAPSDVTDFAPVQKESGGDKIITQYEFHTCEEVGLIKFDILGIRNLSILSSAVQTVEKLHGIKIDLHKIPLDDKKTYEMLSRGETMGVFQMGSAGMTKWIIELKPEKITDLMAMIALYRPGPMATIPDYIDRKRHPEKVTFLDPRMEKFLGASYGLIVYQDDLLFCALDLAGYTWEEADKFRKAVGKKIPEEMAAQKEKFQKGIVEHGQTQEFADTLWKLFEPFQSYGFNKAHAASYGMVVYQTAYMKANYPVEYMCSLLSAEAGDTEKVTAAIAECRRMKIKVLPPDINESEYGFTIINDEESLDKKAIRFGFSAIKNVGGAAIEAILAAREERPFRGFADFLSRIDGRKVNKKVLESLIKVGALSKFGTRAALLEKMDEIRGKVVKPEADAGQDSLFNDEEMNTSADTAALDVRYDYREYTEEELETLERELLGFSLSAKPVSELLGSLASLASHRVHDITSDEDKPTNVKVAAVVSEVREITTKKGDPMAFVKVKDDTGTIELVVFPKIFADTKLLWVENKPLLVDGKVNVRDDSTSILVDRVMTEDSIKADSASGDKLFIRVPEGVQQDQLATLKQLLVANPGNQKVALVFEGPRKQTMELPIRIEWNQNLAHLISDTLRTSLISSEVVEGAN